MPEADYSPKSIINLGNLRFKAKTIVEGLLLGLHHSPYHGFSVEFSQHRPYMSGDDIRHVDWQLYAKTDRYYIKQYEEETNLNTYILIDNSASMAYASEGNISKFEYARLIAASLTYLLINQNDAVGLSVFNDKPEILFPPKSVRSYINELLIALEKTDCSSTTGTADALELICEKMQRKGLVVLISDLLDEKENIMKGLKHLRYLGHDVLVIQLLDPREWELSNSHKHRIKDMESGEEIKLDIRQIKKEYHSRIKAYCDSINRECGENGIDHSLIFTDQDCRTALTEFLRKRERLG
ncbi:MAG: DUF58 domain-containing protein [Candidatus Neomarinimicrobiota bacterium]